MAGQNKQSQLEKWLDNTLWGVNADIKKRRKDFEFDKICKEVDLILSEFDFLYISGTAIEDDSQSIVVLMEDSIGTMCLMCRYFSKKLQVKNYLKSLDSKTADRGTGTVERHV